MNSLRLASISRGLLIIAVTGEQKQIGSELSNISDQLASGKATPQQVDQLSSRFTVLSKRFFALAALALSLSVANPAQAEDSFSRIRYDSDKVFQEMSENKAREVEDRAKELEEAKRKFTEVSTNPSFYLNMKQTLVIKQR